MTVLTPLFTGVWFLIKRWGAMAEKVKRVEAAKVTESIEELKTELSETKKTNGMLSRSLQSTREELIAIKVRLEANTSVGERVMGQVEKMREYTETRLHSMESTLDDGEILKIGANRFMFKGRKEK